LAAQAKPTLFIAVPLALLAANQARLLLGMVLGALAIGLLYTLLLGPTWLPDFLSATVSDHKNLLSAESNTVASLGGIAWAVRALILVLVPLVAWRKSPEVAVIVALAGSLVLTPYLHQEDPLVLFMVAWLFARIHSPRLSVCVAATGLVAAWAFAPLLMIIWEFGVLLVATNLWRQGLLSPLAHRLRIARPLPSF
jgi:hypothetical protein